MKPTAVVIIADGTEEIEAIVPIDLLRRADVAVTVVSASAHKEITGKNGIRIIADSLLSSLLDPDLQCDALIIAGGPTAQILRTHELVIEVVRNQFRANNIVAAICAAPLVLLEAGVLKT